MLQLIPNAISATRAVMAIAAALCIYQPRLALWLFIAAVLTDAVDGPLARHLGVANQLGDYFDQGADWVLAVAGITALLLVGWLSWWTLALILPIAILFAWIRLIVPADSPVQSQAGLPGALYFVAIVTLVVVGLTIRAYGWHPWYIATAALVLLAFAAFKRSRLSHWLAPWRRPRSRKPLQ